LVRPESKSKTIPLCMLEKSVLSGKAKLGNIRYLRVKSLFTKTIQGLKIAKSFKIVLVQTMVGGQIVAIILSKNKKNYLKVSSELKHFNGGRHSNVTEQAGPTIF
jgi:hypothetical protein